MAPVTDGNEPGAAPLASVGGERRGRVDKYQGIVAAWNARLETEGREPIMLRLELKQLSERLDKALARNQIDGPPVPYWIGQPEAEFRSELADLRGWVEGFARPNYPGYAMKLPECWPNHPEAIWELSTVMAEWLRVYGDADNRDLGGALAWHGKWFPDVLSRLATAIRCGEAGIPGCSRVREPPR
jgi:hypothetical protein